MKQIIITGTRRCISMLRHTPIMIVPYIIFALVSPAWAAEKIHVFPQSAYDAHIIYQNLAIFWLFILALIVIIRMKIKEIERTQKLGVDVEDENAPRLD